MKTKTARDYFWQSHARVFGAICHVMEMLNDPKNPLVKKDLHKLADRFPERWEQYRHLLDDD